MLNAFGNNCAMHGLCDRDEGAHKCLLGWVGFDTFNKVAVNFYKFRFYL